MNSYGAMLLVSFDDFTIMHPIYYFGFDSFKIRRIVCSNVLLFVSKSMYVEHIAEFFKEKV